MHYEAVLVKLPTIIREGEAQRVMSPAQVGDLCADMVPLCQEALHVLTLDARNGLISRHMVSLGTVDQALACPRDIFRCALLDNAASIILVHNHPSGDAMPTGADVAITRQVVEAGRIIEIPVLDHIIVGRKVFSMSEAGLVRFDGKGNADAWL